MKKQLIICMVVMMLCLSLVLAISNEISQPLMDKQVGVSVSSADVANGEVFAVKINGSLKTPNKAAAAQFILVYDSTKVTLEGSSPVVSKLPPSWKSDYLTTDSDTPNEVFFSHSYVGIKDLTVTGNFPIAEITFKAIAEGDAVFSLKKVELTSSGKNIAGSEHLGAIYKIVADKGDAPEYDSDGCVKGVWDYYAGDGNTLKKSNLNGCTFEDNADQLWCPTLVTIVGGKQKYIETKGNFKICTPPCPPTMELKSVNGKNKCVLKAVSPENTKLDLLLETVKKAAEDYSPDSNKLKAITSIADALKTYFESEEAYQGSNEPKNTDASSSALDILLNSVENAIIAHEKENNKLKAITSIASALKTFFAN